MDLDSLEAKIQAAIAGSRGAVRRARRSASEPGLWAVVLRHTDLLFFLFCSQSYPRAVPRPEHFPAEEQCGQPIDFAITRHSRGSRLPQ
jgi:hypothetical protein